MTELTRSGTAMPNVARVLSDLMRLCSSLHNAMRMHQLGISMLYLTVYCRHAPSDSPTSIKGVDGRTGSVFWTFPPTALANAK